MPDPREQEVEAVAEAKIIGPAGVVLAAVAGPRDGVAEDVAEEVSAIVSEGLLDRITIEITHG